MGKRKENANKEEKSFDEYLGYVENGDSAAVYLVRDKVKAVPTRGKWVDIVNARQKDNMYCKNAFLSITVELFPRTMQPVYPAKKTFKAGPLEHFKYYDKYCAYITWKTAMADIEKQRNKKVKGERYTIKLRPIKRKKENPKHWEDEFYYEHNILSVTPENGKALQAIEKMKASQKKKKPQKKSQKGC